MQKMFYTIKEVVELTGLSKSTIYRRIKDGSIPIFPYGGKLLIPVEFFSKINREVIQNAGSN